MVLMHGIQAALWDRAFGGSTLIIHIEGATRPNSPKSPEYIKSDVYFPGYLIEENPRFSPIISQLVQDYIVNIGIPVIKRWELCARLNWRVNQGQGREVPLPYPPQPIQPDAMPRGSSTFVYHGRKISSDHHIVDDGFRVEELTPSMMEELKVIEEREYYKSQVDTLQSTLSKTENDLRNSLAREEQLKSELDNIKTILSTRVD
jgi:hypothetical protein